MEPPVTYRVLTASQLINEVGEWAKSNFPSRCPFTTLLGLLEEVGETAHCRIKRIQNIRGFADQKFYEAALIDALADAVIYLADFTHQKGAYFTFHHNDFSVFDDDESRIINHVLISLCALWSFENSRGAHDESLAPAVMQNYNVLCQKFLTALEIWARLHKLDLQKIANETWCREVSKRDWKKDALAGGSHAVAVD